MHSQVLDDVTPLVAEEGSQAMFFATMAEGLHALAQPLTILRSSVMACMIPGISAVKQRHYLDLSAEQVQRACILFEQVQDLVIANQMEAECAPIDLGAMVATAVDDLTTTPQKPGVELTLLLPETIAMALGDAGRALQAILVGLKTAMEVSAAGDAVQIVVTARGPWVELVIRNDRVHGVTLNSSARLSLSLARTNILSQQGEFEHSEDPFRVRMALPFLLSAP
jgi:signal transduction histidine kinase